MCFQRLDDFICDNHCRQTLFTIDNRRVASLHTSDKVGQLLSQGIGAAAIDWQRIDLHELSEHILLQLFDVCSGLS